MTPAYQTRNALPDVLGGGMSTADPRIVLVMTRDDFQETPRISVSQTEWERAVRGPRKPPATRALSAPGVEGAIETTRGRLRSMDG